jgi:hypothetical protein
MHKGWGAEISASGSYQAFYIFPELQKDLRWKKKKKGIKLSTNARMSTRQIHFLQMFFVAEELKTRI